MFNKTSILFGTLMTFCLFVNAEEMEVVGNVESKCVVTPDTAGVYGNPTPDVLSSDPTDGGVDPIVRFDVIQASFYKARITTPNGFSESPVLNDVVNWSGAVTVGEVSDANMSAYSTSKVEYDNTTEIELTVAGSTWFNVDSIAEYGYDTALPAGTYRAIVSAECIAL